MNDVLLLPGRSEVEEYDNTAVRPDKAHRPGAMPLDPRACCMKASLMPCIDPRRCRIAG
ncbi:MAG: hypothetical protein ACLTW9_25570 [Enterocloster sp.]